MADDEFTPRERGLQIGETWARLTREAGVVATDAEGAEVDPVAAAAEMPPRIAEATREQIMDAGMRERLAVSEDPDAEEGFWAGFVTGVRAYLAQARLGGQN